MTKEKKMRLFKKVKEKLEGIDNAETLKRNGLQLVDLEMLYKVLPAVFTDPAPGAPPLFFFVKRLHHGTASPLSVTQCSFRIHVYYL